MVLVASARLSYNNAFYLKCAFLKTKAQQLKQNQQELLWVQIKYFNNNSPKKQMKSRSMGEA